VDAPDVTGTIELKPITVNALFAKLNQMTGVPGNEVVGPQSSVTLPLQVRLLNPESGGTSAHAPGTVLKTLYIPDARFTIPGYEGRVSQKLVNQLAFTSDRGVLAVFKGLPFDIGPGRRVRLSQAVPHVGVTSRGGPHGVGDGIETGDSPMAGKNSRRPSKNAVVRRSVRDWRACPLQQWRMTASRQDQRRTHRDDDSLIWVSPPSPLQREMAVREAQASRARAMLEGRREGAESISTSIARSFLVNLERTLVTDYVLEIDETDRMTRARRDVLAEKEWEDFNSLRDCHAAVRRGWGAPTTTQSGSLLDRDASVR
jgi:hypothetical protein